MPREGDCPYALDSCDRSSTEDWKGGREMGHSVRQTSMRSELVATRDENGPGGHAQDME